MSQSVAILDYGSQYTQLIARRVRELNVYCEIFPWDANPEQLIQFDPAVYILSGGPSSVYETGAPRLLPYILESGLPVLGICYGMQLLSLALGGSVTASENREYGLAEIDCSLSNPLLPCGSQSVWMSHGDQVSTVPPEFEVLARSTNTPIAAMGNMQKRIYGVQFHPEVHHTPRGLEILQNFLFGICGLNPNWTAENMIASAIANIREQVGDQKVISAVSGGVDSSVATVLVHRAVGSQLSAVFVDTGFLRLGEADQVEATLKHNLGIQFSRVNAQEQYFAALKGISDPEIKRRIIGAKFIEFFEQEASRAGNPPFLVQGTIYPDVVESSAPDRSKAQKIKSHHNVGGLPEKMKFKLIEPLRYLFKDEVRKIGEALGIPSEMVWRQPFPGPGLAVRCLGEITPERIRCLQQADAIFIGELEREGLINQKPEKGRCALAQAFVALLPVRSVGVMGDQRTYQETAVLRAVTSEDFMTADWAQLPHALLGKVANRIVNEVSGINRVVYDITSKPPATIEWE
ncbi:MAG: glutamine-hydrolyzing GMP synthase [Anaerolineaceae bacterium]|nr:glutamine-hydrolyzing GMP synthase [Anaerolineaceae bacterium]